MKKKKWHKCISMKRVSCRLFLIPSLLQLHNTFKTWEYIFFLMEYVDGESLRAFLEQKQKNELLKKNADDFLSDF